MQFQIARGTMVAQAFSTQGNGLGVWKPTLIDPDDYEGDGLYYNDAGNGYNSNGNIMININNKDLLQNG